MKLVRNEPSEELIRLLDLLADLVTSGEATSVVVVMALRGGQTDHMFSSMRDAAPVLGELAICKDAILEKIRENDD